MNRLVKREIHTETHRGTQKKREAKGYIKRLIVRGIKS